MFGVPNAPAKQFRGPSAELFVVVDLAQSLDDLVQGFLPGNLLPAGVDADPFHRIRASQGRVHAVGVVERHDAGDSLAAEPAAADGALRVAFDLDEHAVHHVATDGACAVAEAAGGRDPPVGHARHELPPATIGSTRRSILAAGASPRVTQSVIEASSSLRKTRRWV